MKSTRLSAAAIGFAGLLLTSITGAAADGVAGFEAYEKGDYATALKEFLPLAEAGQTSAEAAVGQMYFEGKGMAPDLKQAARFLEPAAAKGNARAQYLLGKLYLSGEGVAAADPAKAAALTKAAADQGLVDAQVDTCAFYYQGVGVQKDLVQAYKWYGLAAVDSRDPTPGRNRDSLARQMTAEQLAEARRLIAAWKPG